MNINTITSSFQNIAGQLSWEKAKGANKIIV